ncbi:MAG: hypothetical protein IKZ60_06030 [Bacteroidales bacterium]|nr:hypothetical protein [Bacteroidales bacterium]
MKKTSAVIFFVICTLGLCFAQGPKEAGSFYVYDGNALPAMTSAPKGYKPFYISHFARHGARWCTSEYDALHDWLAKASDAGVLTDAGKEFRSRYETFYQKARFCKGNLTEVGQGQHRLIAEHMYQRFPAVFKGQTHVEAVSTESPRVIMSMWSCLSRLDELDKTLDISANASAKHASWLQPSLSSNPYLIKGAFRAGSKAEKEYEDYFEKTVPWREIASRFFTTPDAIESVLKITPVKFIDFLHSIVTCTYCLDEGQGYFDDVFSAEELHQVWKALSAKYFLDVANYTGSETLILDYAGFTLGQIIETADADIASGSTQLRLRFGHDSGIAPLFILLDANGCGRATASFEESLGIFPSYYLPMGANLQLIFYKKTGKPVLVKALVNEREATLPLEPVSGPYYKWEDFKAHYLPLIAASKARIDSFRTPSNQ